MATPTEFPEQNTIIKAAPGTEAWVSDLPIYRQGLSFTPDGQRLDQCVVSCWQLSPEELAEVQRTGVVYFQAFGMTHPPVSVWGTSPFAQPVVQEG
jgi:hypothetical protein